VPSHKNPVQFFAEMGKSILKFMWNNKRLEIAKEILNKIMLFAGKWKSSC
jgi:hypothetical protein